MRWTVPFLLTACAPGPMEVTERLEDTGRVPVLAPSIELSAESQAFVPLTGDESLVVVHGPGGGWHLEISGVVRHVAPIVVLTGSGRRASNGELLTDEVPTHTALDYDEAEDAGFFSEHKLVVDLVNQPDWTRFICDLEGEDLEICVSAQAYEGDGFAEICTPLTLQRDPMDDAEMCATN
jgi:hypothetical protein